MSVMSICGCESLPSNLSVLLDCLAQDDMGREGFVAYVVLGPKKHDPSLNTTESTMILRMIKAKMRTYNHNQEDTKVLSKEQHEH